MNDSTNPDRVALPEEQVRALAEAISQRYDSFDADGSVRFGIEEAVYAVTELFQAWDPAFDATAFKHTCFGSPDPEEPSMGYRWGEDR